MTETIAGAAQLWRKKPVTVSAVRWTGVNEDELTEFARAESLGSHFYVLDDEDRANCADPAATAQVYDKLHSTWVLVYDGQWIVKGVKGEFYPCAPDVFAETYEAAAGSPPVSRDALEQLAEKWKAEADDARPDACGPESAHAVSRRAAVRQKRICTRQLLDALGVELVDAIGGAE
jgi:hypothetical protein